MGQCKCRSSDHSKEPGWHHEQPRRHPHQQQKRAQQLGENWGPSSFLSSSFLFAKLFLSQPRAKTGWQGLLVFWMPLPLVVLSIHRSSTSSLPQFCKEDEAEDGAAGPLLCVELDGEVQNLVRRRRSPTSLTGGGISFGSGFSLGSGLGLAGLGTAFNAATA